MRALIIEDDRSVVETVILSFHITWPDMKVTPARLGKDGIDLAEVNNPDIIILDLGLPDISGFEVLRQIRLFSSVPIIVLSVQGDETAIIKALELGADEYVTKPFRQLELIARIRAMLRRHNPPEGQLPLIVGEFSYYPVLKRLVGENKVIQLTTIESLILYKLLRHPNKEVTHQSLCREIWGDDNYGSTESLRVHVRHLREKMEDDPANPKLICTVIGIGYLIKSI